MVWERTPEGPATRPGREGAPAQPVLRVLVVHRDRRVLDRVERLLEDGPYRVCAVAEPGQAIALARLFELDVALVGPATAAGAEGTLAPALQRARPGLRCIRICGAGEPHRDGSAAPGFDALLRPPLDAQTLRAAVDAAPGPEDAP